MEMFVLKLINMTGEKHNTETVAYGLHNGRRSFKYRSDLRDGWLLSNSELIAVALGR